MTRMLRTALLAAAALLMGACSSHDYNPTTAPYQINREAIAKKPIKKVMIASANISGEPTRYFMQKPAVRIDARVKQYLEAHGYQVVPNYPFENAYNQAVHTYGNLYDPTTGRVDPTTWRAVIATALKSLQPNGIDAVIFTDLIERDVSHSIGLDHMASWDGVSRKPGFSSAGASLAEGFDWNKTLKAATLVITIYNADLEGVFSSRGGLDTLQVIDAKRSPAAYVRRKNTLDSDSNIEEGIEIAFHPFIIMKDYPGKETK